MLSPQAPSAHMAWHYNSEFKSLRELHLGRQVSSDSSLHTEYPSSNMTSSPDSRAASLGRPAFREQVDDVSGSREETIKYGFNHFPQSPYKTPPREKPTPAQTPTYEKMDLSTDGKSKPAKKSVWGDNLSPNLNPGKLGGDDEKVGKGVERKVFRGRGWLTAPFVFGGELGERSGSFGLQLNLINYLIYEMNMPLVSAATTVTNFFGISSMASVGGAFLADAYLGRFLTIAGGCAFYLAGLLLFTLAATTPSLRPPPCSKKELFLGQCTPANSFQMGVLYISFVLQCFGSGAVRPCVAPFGADQFDKNDKKHESQLRHYFNWYYMCIAMSFLISLTLTVYIQDDIGWGWGAGVCAILMGVGFGVFMMGVPFYMFVPPKGSPMTSLLQVAVAALRKHKLILPDNPDQLYKARLYEDKGALATMDEILTHTENFRFLDKAAIVVGDPDAQTKQDPWKLRTVHQVEELKILVRMAPIWLCAVIVSTVISQSSTLAVRQAVTMDLKLGPLKIPPASMNVFSVLAVIVFIPIYDLIAIKVLRKVTGHPKGLSYLQRIGIGLFLSVVTMIVAALVEGKRRNTAYNTGLVDLRPGAILPMSGLWLVPQFVLSGFAESFLVIGELEFFYDEAPFSIRTMSNAFLWAALGLGSFLSSALVNIVQDITKRNGQGGWIQTQISRGHLDSFYWLLALLTLINAIFFMFVSKWYVYKNANVYDFNDSTSSSSSDNEKDLQKGGRF